MWLADSAKWNYDRRGAESENQQIDGRRYPAITNIGKNPTFEGKQRTIETFIFHFYSNIYGKSFTLEWVERIRGEIRFPSPEALAAQIQKDIQRAEEILERR